MRLAVFENEIYELLRHNIRGLMSEVTKPEIEEYENAGRYPGKFVERLARHGLLGVFVPAEFGGAGMDTLAYTIVEEEIARIWAGLGLIISAHNSLCVGPILAFGTEEQKRQLLPPLARGEKLGCFALTEPDAGTDALGMKTRAIRCKCGSGEHYSHRVHYAVRGSKCFITNASEASVCVLVARTGDDRKNGLSAFVIESDKPGFRGVDGFTVGKPEEKAGLHASQTCVIDIDDLIVPEENMLGKEGDGLKIVLGALNGGRINIAAQALGMSQRAMELAVDYVKGRKAYGGVLANKDEVKSKIGEMKTLLDAGRLLVYQAAWLKDNGKPYESASAEAKYFCSEYGDKIVDMAWRLHGGYGFMKDYEIERLKREISITRTYEGISEVQLLNIAKCVLG